MLSSQCLTDKEIVYGRARPLAYLITYPEKTNNRIPKRSIEAGLPGRMVTTNLETEKVPLIPLRAPRRSQVESEVPRQDAPHPPTDPFGDPFPADLTKRRSIWTIRKWPLASSLINNKQEHLEDSAQDPTRSSCHQPST